MIAQSVKKSDVIETLMMMLRERDCITYQHSLRVAFIAEMIAEKVNSRGDFIEKIKMAALLHDIGKVGISDTILNKPGKLNRKEIKRIQSHPEIGYRILQKTTIFEDVSFAALYHHERFDGQGYPEGLKGEEIPLEARIIAVADAFDAIVSDRPYRKGLTYTQAFEEINQHVQSQFCPRVVNILNQLRTILPDKLDQIKLEKLSAACTDFAAVDHEEIIHSRKAI